MSSEHHDLFDPSETRIRRSKQVDWRQAIEDSKLVNTNSDWRDNSSKVFNSDRIFKDIRKARNISKQNEANQLPPEYQEISKEEVDKMGFCEDTRQKKNIVRKQQRNQYYHNKGLHYYEE